MGFTPRGELYQIHAVSMPVETGCLGVDGDQGLGAKPPEQGGEFGCVIDEAEWAVVHERNSSESGFDPPTLWQSGEPA